MNKRRLLKLADLLEADAKNKKGIKFDLQYVGVLNDWSTGPFEINCRTTACAMGLAAISGAFKRAGLSHQSDGMWLDTLINGRKVNYDRAAMNVFDLSMREADFLFTPAFYENAPGGLPRAAKGERYVAKRIRDFVAGKVSP